MADRPGDYRVGYGNPPLHTRFRKGQSGNPRGRPRGAASLARLLQQALDRRVTIVEDGHERRVTQREAVIAQLVAKSAQADLRAIRLLLDMVQATEEPPAPAPDWLPPDGWAHEQLRLRLARLAAATTETDANSDPDPEPPTEEPQ
jgi:antitoxin (DNA-binding transcriptional repressor) of toxin-antitoxin stability system